MACLGRAGLGTARRGRVTGWRTADRSRSSYLRHGMPCQGSAWQGLARRGRVVGWRSEDRSLTNYLLATPCRLLMECEVQGKIYGQSYQAARKRRLKFAGNKCETCSGKESLECHHKCSESYTKDCENRMTYKDVIILCLRCHDAITNSQRSLRYEGKTIGSVDYGKQEIHCPFDRTNPTGASQQLLRGPTTPTEKGNIGNYWEKEEGGCRSYSAPQAGVRGWTVSHGGGWPVRPKPEHPQNAHRSGEEGQEREAI